MGKKLDVLLGRTSKTAKLKLLTNLAISRIAILKRIHSVRCSQDQSDVIQLMQLGHEESALIRVEHVIKEQNTLDAFVLIENYCNLLGESAERLKNSRECPDDLKEAISSLIFADSRCGEFPELQEIRRFFTSQFGKEFATRAVELRNNCGVCPEIIRRLSKRQTSLESRLQSLKQLAKDNGIGLQLDHEAFKVSREEKCDTDILQMLVSIENAIFNDQKIKVIPLDKNSPRATASETLSESSRRRKAYEDVAAAAQDAFESAAAAVQLSRLKPSDDDHSSSRGQYSHSSIFETKMSRDVALEEVNYLIRELKLVKIH